MDRLSAFITFMQIVLAVSVICSLSFVAVLFVAYLRTDFRDHVAALLERMDEEYADHMEAHAHGWDLYIHGWSLRGAAWGTTNWQVLTYRIQREAFYWRYQVVHRVWMYQNRKHFASL